MYPFQSANTEQSDVSSNENQESNEGKTLKFNFLINSNILMGSPMPSQIL